MKDHHYILLREALAQWEKAPQNGIDDTDAGFNLADAVEFVLNDQDHNDPEE